MSTALVVVGVVVLLLLVVVGMYNGLVRRRVECDNGWSQIDVQCKRRYDLIPNLVEIVKGYAAHEKTTLSAVIEARNQAARVPPGAEHAAARATAEGAFTAAIGRLFAVAEAYPDLKANQNFGALQEEVASTENRIGFARQHFNDVVAQYEQSRMTFPTNFVAGMFGFAKRDFFQLDEAAARQAPQVKLT